MQKRYWLRGLTGGFVVGLFAVFSWYFLLYGCGKFGVCGESFRGYILYVVHYLNFFNRATVSTQFLNSFMGPWLYQLLSPIFFYSIAGLLFGWLYGKIKSRSIHTS